MAGTFPNMADLTLPDHAAWDLRQLVPVSAVYTRWKWEYGVTPFSDITASNRPATLSLMQISIRTTRAGEGGKGGVIPQLTGAPAAACFDADRNLPRSPPLISVNPLH